MKRLVENWEEFAKEHTRAQNTNPFSGSYDPATEKHLHPGDNGYGKPVPGSRTDLRGKTADHHVHKEINQLVELIRTKYGSECRFGQLFEDYVDISNKVVGICLRARKAGVLDFDNNLEMLYQGRDDNVTIKIVKIERECISSFSSSVKDCPTTQAPSTQ